LLNEGAHREWRADVLVEGGVVKAVGLDLNVPSDALRLDATGKFVLPGTYTPPFSSSKHDYTS
jgi:dihydropyrimidinase